jgi:hypothetical protein
LQPVRNEFLSFAPSGAIGVKLRTAFSLLHDVLLTLRVTPSRRVLAPVLSNLCASYRRRRRQAGKEPERAESLYELDFAHEPGFDFLDEKHSANCGLWRHVRTDERAEEAARVIQRMLLRDLALGARLIEKAVRAHVRVSCNWYTVPHTQFVAVASIITPQSSQGSISGVGTRVRIGIVSRSCKISAT